MTRKARSSASHAASRPGPRTTGSGWAGSAAQAASIGSTRTRTRNMRRDDTSRPMRRRRLSVSGACLGLMQRLLEETPRQLEELAQPERLYQRRIGEPPNLVERGEIAGHEDDRNPRRGELVRERDAAFGREA